MVRPAAFGFNPETEASNAFQQKPEPGATAEQIQSHALSEFEGVVEMLEAEGVRVHVFDDTLEPVTPDAVFPNNWVSFHPEGAVLYPMASPIRRKERRMDILEALGKPVLHDFSSYELQDEFLEGTGSLVIDRKGGFVFICVSPRTDRMLAFRWSQAMGLKLIDFETQGPDGRPVYHSNVVGYVGDGFAVACAEVVVEQAILRLFTTMEDVTFVEITAQQMASFCGNIIQLEGKHGRIIAMSSTAYQAFTEAQRATLEQFGKLVHAPIPTIERIGGGSVRCMITEVF